MTKHCGDGKSILPLCSAAGISVQQLVSPTCNHMENSSERTARRFCYAFPRKLQLACNCRVHVLCQDAMFALHKQPLLCTSRFTPNMFDITTLTTLGTSPSNGTPRSWFIFNDIKSHLVHRKLIISAYCGKMSNY
jgi:hypothetical protein